MSSFTLTNTAEDIDSAISRVVDADTTPTIASQKMVTSSGIKAAFDDLATSNTLTTDSFTPDALQSSNDGLTATDTAVPTSKAVKEYVDSLSSSAGSNSITILPTHFTGDGTISQSQNPYTGYVGLSTHPQRAGCLTLNSGDSATAQINIPSGLKATAIKIYGWIIDFNVKKINITNSSSSTVVNSNYSQSIGNSYSGGATNFPINVAGDQNTFLHLNVSYRIVNGSVGGSHFYGAVVTLDTV